MNVARLRGIIAEKGLSQRKVAEYLGITEKTFYAKMKKGVFCTDEVQKMIELLDIADPVNIFLCKK